MSFAATWMDLEVIILSEIDKDECHITYIWNLKYDTKELIKKKKKTETQETNLWLPKWKGG